MTEGYPNIENSEGSDSQSQQNPYWPHPDHTILVTYLEKKAAVDISAALTVEDVKSTLLDTFNVRKTARVVLRRASDGAVVVPGPKLAHGEYLLEEIEGAWKIAYKNIRDVHYPNARQQVREKHLPAVKGALQKTGDSLSVVHSQVSSGLSTVGTHVGSAVGTAGSTVRGGLRRATNIANTHAATNSHTWTAKLWSGLVRCAPGPLSWVTGIPQGELPPEAAPSESTVSETVPLSKPAEPAVNSAA